MHHWRRALVGLAMLTLVVNGVGPRMHGHPSEHGQSGSAFVHSHGIGDAHSHGPAPATPDDSEEQHDTEIVLIVDPAVSVSSSATVTAPVFLPEGIATLASAVVWVRAPGTTPVRAHSPPSTSHLPARAPPRGTLQHS